MSHVLTYKPAAVGVFNLSDPVVVSQQAWIERIAEVAAWDGKIVILPDISSSTAASAIQLRSRPEY